MQDSSLLSSLRSAYLIQVADTPALVREAQRVRYQVFVRERAIFAGNPDQELEIDDFDAWSHHLLIRRRDDREVIGTARLVTFQPDKLATFPIQRVCNPERFIGLPLHTTGEISRFALSKQRRGNSHSHLDSLLILTLVEGILQLSKELGLTHWCAVMERSLLRLLRGIGIHFEPLGPMVSYYGQRQPAVARIASLLTEGQERAPIYYHFITGSRPDRDLPAPEQLAA